MVMDDLDELIERIDMEYDRSEGFLGRLRSGTFDPAGAQRLLALLGSLDLGAGPVDRRLVQLLWYMPIFMEWQKARLSASDAAETESTLNEVMSTLERVIGVP
jgi:hypothetical protein